ARSSMRRPRSSARSSVAPGRSPARAAGRSWPRSRQPLMATAMATVTATATSADGSAEPPAAPAGRTGAIEQGPPPAAVRRPRDCGENRAAMYDTAVMIMAGGRGSRLGPLTVHRSKPAVPFGGRYRIIDFVLSNFVNSGYRRIYVLTQYMASSLIRHLNRAWRLSGFGEFVEVVPAQMRVGEFWYRGTADAVYQNVNLIRDESASQVAVFGGDHVYMFAVDQMEAVHRARGADLTVAAFPVPRSEAHQFGIIDVDAEGR